MTSNKNYQKRKVNLSYLPVFFHIHATASPTEVEGLQSCLPPTLPRHVLVVHHNQMGAPPHTQTDPTHPPTRPGPPACISPSPHRSPGAGCTTAPPLHQPPAPDTADRTSPPAHS